MREKILNRLIPLAAPKEKGDLSFEETLRKRKSHRYFKKETISFETFSQLIWSAQGELKDGRRVAPSAGAIYPFNLYVMTDDFVRNLIPGLYAYDAGRHSLKRLDSRDLRPYLSEAALSQNFIAVAPIVIILTANLDEISKVYGSRAERYVFMEAGHIGQNIYLQAAAMNLGTVAVGAFHDERVGKLLNLPHYEIPGYIFPVGAVP